MAAVHEDGSGARWVIKAVIMAVALTLGIIALGVMQACDVTDRVVGATREEGEGQAGDGFDWDSVAISAGLDPGLGTDGTTDEREVPILPDGVRGLELLETSARIVDTRSDALGEADTWVVDLEPGVCGAAILDTYRESGAFTPSNAGYLDLMGLVWAVLMDDGQGHVHMVLVDGRTEALEPWGAGDGGGCTLTITRLNGGEVIPFDGGS